MVRELPLRIETADGRFSPERTGVVSRLLRSVLIRSVLIRSVVLAIFVLGGCLTSAPHAQAEGWWGGFRDCLRQWSENRVRVEYGLDLAGHRVEPHAEQPLVIFLHGLNSRPEDMQPLICRVQQAGFACVTFRYPNDQPLQESARQFATALRKAPLQDRAICLVTHSMGGLVARAVIEDPALDSGTVRQLIMIAPPTHGSELAKYAVSLDLVEYASSPSRRREAGPLAGAVADGFSEALRDLRPGSKFLRQLNARERNPRVSYSLVIGTAAHIAPSRLQKCRNLLAQSSTYCRWMGECLSQWDACVEAVPEVIDGVGDGVVAVQRSRLDGVDDVLLARVAHADLLSERNDAEIERVQRWIIERIEASPELAGHAAAGPRRTRPNRMQPEGTAHEVTP
jgi:pimeloyl-ACP methyl ester carboxylesterase